MLKLPKKSMTGKRGDMGKASWNDDARRLLGTAWGGGGLVSLTPPSPPGVFNMQCWGNSLKMTVWLHPLKKTPHTYVFCLFAFYYPIYTVKE